MNIHVSLSLLWRKSNHNHFQIFEVSEQHTRCPLVPQHSRHGRKRCCQDLQTCTYRKKLPIILIIYILVVSLSAPRRVWGDWEQGENNVADLDSCTGSLKSLWRNPHKWAMTLPSFMLVQMHCVNVCVMWLCPAVSQRKCRDFFYPESLLFVVFGFSGVQTFLFLSFFHVVVYSLTFTPIVCCNLF